MNTENSTKPLTASQKRSLAWKEQMQKIREIKDGLGKDYCSSMYLNITKAELSDAIANAKWILKSDVKEKSEYSDILESYSSRTSSLAGLTDYNNHSEDTLEQLKAAVLEQLETRLMQRLNYWSTTGKQFDIIIVSGHRGGWLANCAWSDGSKAYSTIA